jgi:HEAT repeat protein
MNGRRVALLAGILLAGGTLTAAAAMTHSRAWRRTVNVTHSDSLRPGPDSGRVAQLLSALGATDPLICELISDQLGNFWTSNGRSGLGRFSDASLPLQAAKDSVSGHVRDPRAIRLLETNLNAENSCVRRLSAKLLGQSAEKTDELLRQLGSSSSRVREAAAYAIGEGERKEARSALERALQERPGAEAAMYAWAIGEIQDTASLPALTRAARAPNARVRLASVWALGAIEDARAIPELEHALADDNMGVRYAAAEAFGSLHDVRTAPSALVHAAQSGDTELKRLAARALAEIHDPATIDVLIALVTSANRETRLDAVRALGEIRSPKAVPILVRALKDADPEVRKSAAEVLGEIKPAS